MSEKNELDNLFGMNNEAAAFLIVLKDFVESLAGRLKSHPEYIRPLLNDIESHPDDWFKLWCEELGMGKHLVIFASATKLLLQQYSEAHLREVFQTLERTTKDEQT